MGDGALRLERRWTALAGTGGAALAGANKPFTIAIDGTAVGAVAPKETVEVAVEHGHHTLRLGQGRHLSPERSFDVAQDENVEGILRYALIQVRAGLARYGEVLSRTRGIDDGSHQLLVELARQQGSRETDIEGALTAS
jgi:hypothetical protein